MAVMQTSPVSASTRAEQMLAEVHHERWAHWPVNWSAVFVGALASLAALLVFGLIGLAVGAHLVGPEHRVVDLHKIAIGTLIASVCGAFFAFVIGGWVAGKIAGILHSEPAMLHGAISWLVAIPFVLFLASIGAANYMGGWYGGLNASPSNAAILPFDKPDPLDANATEAERSQYRAANDEYQTKVRQWREDTPRAMRNAALGSLTAILLGLVGSVIGGWLACGEPMNFSHYRTRNTSAAHI